MRDQENKLVSNNSVKPASPIATVRRFAEFWASGDDQAIYLLLRGAASDVRASTLVEHLTRVADALERHAFACRLAVRAAKGESLSGLNDEWQKFKELMDQVHEVTR